MGPLSPEPAVSKVLGRDKGSSESRVLWDQHGSKSGPGPPQPKTSANIGSQAHPDLLAQVSWGQGLPAPAP